jgi:hypothetical protein
MDRIYELRAAENLLMFHNPSVEGDITPLITGYKILTVRFEAEFRRPWTPSSDFKRWAKVNNPGLIKEE